MSNEETKVFDQSEETVLMNDTTEKTEGAEATQEAKKNSGIGGKAAFAAGGFVDYEEIAGTEVVEEQPVTPATEEVLIATDEGVRIAQVIVADLVAPNEVSY